MNGVLLGVIEGYKSEDVTLNQLHSFQFWLLSFVCVWREVELPLSEFKIPS